MEHISYGEGWQRFHNFTSNQKAALVVEGRSRGETRNAPTCLAVVPLCGTKAEVTVPSLDDWEKEWQEKPQRNMQPKLLPLIFRSLLAAVAQSN